MRTATGTRIIACALVAVASVAVVRPAAAVQSDAWITTKAKIALLTTAGVHGTTIHVNTVAGTVELHGTVSSAAEKTRAESVVQAIDGVQGVHDLLRVASQRRHATPAVDADVQVRAEQALAADAWLRDSGVQVESVDAGVVALGGHARTLTEHLRALEIIARVDGVRQVTSTIESPDSLAKAETYADPNAGSGQPAGAAARAAADLWTTTEVKLRILTDRRTPGLDVKVDTTDGTVTLFGTVTSQEAKTAAGEDARGAGVRAVDNALRVVPAAKRALVAATAQATPDVRAVNDDLAVAH